MPSSYPSKTLRLGTRGSLLAKVQSNATMLDLIHRNPGLKIETIVIGTTGDRVLDRPLHDIGGKGLFTKELEQALLAGLIDFAVHSLKDVPVTMPLVDTRDLIIAATPPREDPRDVLVSPIARRLDNLPNGARVGTGSLRRRCQILARRADLNITPLRGNVDTRLRKLRAGDFDAIVLALAGVKRCGLFDESIMTPIDLSEMLPAAGQGALALQCRRDDEETRRLLESLDDVDTRRCVDAERAIVAALNGDCHSPIGALATVSRDGAAAMVDRDGAGSVAGAAATMRLRAAVGARGGHPPVISATAEGPADRAAETVDKVVKMLGVETMLAGLKATGESSDSTASTTNVIASPHGSEGCSNP